MNKKKSKLKVVGIILVALLLLVAIAFGIYVSDYYKATDEAYIALESTDSVTVTEEKDYIFFDGPSETEAYIFYPGAKVETESYAPLMEQIAKNGIDVYLVDMPFHLAFFGMNRAADIIEENSQYESWYIGGHSLGGAMAASFAADHLEELDGAILLAAYPTKSLDAEGFRVLTFYGSEDQVLNMEKIEEGRSFMPEDYEEIVIDGGNHANFGNYGAQDGDGEATISAEEQQKMVVEGIF